MRFGVVVCPNCKKVKGVELSRKTTKCPRCGRVLQLKHLKIFYKTNSQQKLVQAIGLISADLEGKGNTFKNLFSKKN